MDSAGDALAELAAGGQRHGLAVLVSQQLAKHGEDAASLGRDERLRQHVAVDGHSGPTLHRLTSTNMSARQDASPCDHTKHAVTPSFSSFTTAPEIFGQATSIHARPSMATDDISELCLRYQRNALGAVESANSSALSKPPIERIDPTSRGAPTIDARSPRSPVSQQVMTSAIPIRAHSLKASSPPSTGRHTSPEQSVAATSSGLLASSLSPTVSPGPSMSTIATTVLSSPIAAPVDITTKPAVVDYMHKPVTRRMQPQDSSTDDRPRSSASSESLSSTSSSRQRRAAQTLVQRLPLESVTAPLSVTYNNRHAQMATSGGSELSKILARAGSPELHAKKAPPHTRPQSRQSDRYGQSSPIPEARVRTTSLISTSSQQNVRRIAPGHRPAQGSTSSRPSSQPVSPAQDTMRSMLLPAQTPSQSMQSDVQILHQPYPRARQGASVSTNLRASPRSMEERELRVRVTASQFPPGRTYPPATHPATGNAAAPSMPQRNSAPLLSVYTVPDHSPGAPLADRSGLTEVLRDSTYAASPAELQTAIRDSVGFGSSSPYPPLPGPLLSAQRFSVPTHLNSVPIQRNLSNPVKDAIKQDRVGQSSQQTSKSVRSPIPTGIDGKDPFPQSDRNMAGIGVNGSVLAPAALQTRAQPDTIRPMGQEICLECLMRDRDMADIEVTGPGVWSRASDADYEEALRNEEAAISAAQARQASIMAGFVDQSNTVCSEDSTRLRDADLATEEPSLAPSWKRDGIRHISMTSRDSSTSEDRLARSRENYVQSVVPIPKRVIGGGHHLLSDRLTLWTAMNKAPSSHRYQVLKDFVQEQNRYIELERLLRVRVAGEGAEIGSQEVLAGTERYYEQPVSPVSPSGQYGAGPLRTKRDEARRVRSPNNSAGSMTLEFLNGPVDSASLKSNIKGTRRTSASSVKGAGTKRREQTEPSPSLLALSSPSLPDPTIVKRAPISPSGSMQSVAPPWAQQTKRRFSSPLLSNRMRNSSTEQLVTERGPRRMDAESRSDFRMSTQSAAVPLLDQLLTVRTNGFRSPSPSRQSFMTVNTGYSPSMERGSKWRRSFWNSSRSGSASASVLSFGGGSMVEMHLGMSQDKHARQLDPTTSELAVMYAQRMHPSSGTWPDSASVMDESAGISADENVDAAKTHKKRKKGFRKFVTSLFGSPPRNASSSRDDARGERRSGTRQKSNTASTDQYGSNAVVNDDSEPLAPPPPLSFLTGQARHRRSFSSSSQMSVPSPTLSAGDGQQPYILGGQRQSSLGVLNQHQHQNQHHQHQHQHQQQPNGFISPSASSADLYRNRPPSVHSWRSSIKTGNGPHTPQPGTWSMPAIRQDSQDEVAYTHRVQPSMNTYDNFSTLQREKSLPDLPPGQHIGEEQYVHHFHPAMLSHNQGTMPPQHFYGNHDQQYQLLYAKHLHEHQQEIPEVDDYRSLSEQTKRAKKSRSRIFSFASGKKSKPSMSPPIPPDSASARYSNQVQRHSPHPLPELALIGMPPHAATHHYGAAQLANNIQSYVST